MLRHVVGLVVAAVLVSGCFGKDASRADMEEQATEALAKFRQDVLPGGRLESVQVTGWIKVETDFGGMAAKVTLNPDVAVRIGPDGQVLIDGTLASMRLQGYCDPQHIVTVTERTAQYGIPEGRTEMRNPIGFCSGPGSEQLLLQAFEFELIDPVILTGQLHPENMTAVAFSDEGKNKIEAEYTTPGPAGTTTLFVKVHGDKVTQVIAENVDSRLVMDMAYGQRTPVEKPAADQRIPSPVTGQERRDEDGWHWEGKTREGGPVAEYSLEVYEDGAQVGCASVDAEPVVTFDLGGPSLQEKSGWRMLLTEDGDGLLGAGDKILVSPPNTIVQDVDHEFVIWDDWADRNARDLGCAMPGFGGAFSLVGVAAAGAVVLRRRGA